jgi:hypothetical protein
MITVEVGRSGVKVYISASTGFLGTGGVREATTDSRGNAYINFDDYGPTFNGEIFVAGNSIYKGRIDANGIYPS